MRRRAFTAALLVVLGVSGPLDAAPARLEPLSLSAYIGRLSALKQAVAALTARNPTAATRLGAGLEDHWSVQMGDRTVEVPAAWLKSGLGAWARDPTPADQARLVGALDLLGQDALATETPAPVEASSARAALGRILAEREFRDVRAPGLVDDLRRRLLLFFLGLLERLFGSASAAAIGDGVGYALVALFVGLLVLIFTRLGRLSLASNRPAFGGGPALTGRSSDLLDDAKRAAEAGAWRDAVRLAYWSGVAALEHRGFWRPDRSRTPREYVRLLPADREPRTSLLAFTRLLERVWYADEPAGPAEFAQALEHCDRLDLPAHDAR
jgi:hypothetical protein